MAETEHLRVRLADGRSLAVEVSGPRDGTPFIWHHGTPGCAYQPLSRRRALAERGLRSISYTRPGGPGSTRLPRRCVVDAAADVAAIADHLGIDRFLTGGASGGGPHALATAAALPERVIAVLAVSSLKPFVGEPDFTDGMGSDNAESIHRATQGDLALWPFLEAQQPALLAATADEVIAGLGSVLSDDDRALLTSERGADLLRDLQGGADPLHGWLDDVLALVTHWGFHLTEVTVPVHLWHGSEDRMVPFHHGRWLAERIPDVTAHLVDGEGHLSVTVAGFARMIEELVC